MPTRWAPWTDLTPSGTPYKLTATAAPHASTRLMMARYGRLRAGCGHAWPVSGCLVCRVTALTVPTKPSPRSPAQRGGPGARAARPRLWLRRGARPERHQWLTDGEHHGALEAVDHSRGGGVPGHQRGDDPEVATHDDQARTGRVRRQGRRSGRQVAEGQE